MSNVSHDKSTHRIAGSGCHSNDLRTFICDRRTVLGGRDTAIPDRRLRSWAIFVSRCFVVVFRSKRRPVLPVALSGNVCGGSTAARFLLARRGCALALDGCFLFFADCSSQSCSSRAHAYAEVLQQLRLNRDREASHNLNRLLDKPDLVSLYRTKSAPIPTSGTATFSNNSQFPPPLFNSPQRPHTCIFIMS